MCFSAAGSFAIAGVLTVVGGVSVARNPSRAHRLFAATPLLFAAQQAAEGVVWSTIHGDHHAALHRLAVTAFLGFAVVVWPVWLPASLQLIERDPVRLRLLGALVCFGALVALYAALLMTRLPHGAHVAGHSISYTYEDGSGMIPSELVGLLGYLVPTVMPFFVSTATLARTIGVTLIGSLIATVVVQRDALTSVWCFFAAILSCLILAAVEKDRRAGAQAAGLAELPSSS
jgi:hypothetical protein